MKKVRKLNVVKHIQKTPIIDLGARHLSRLNQYTKISLIYTKCTAIYSDWFYIACLWCALFVHMYNYYELLNDWTIIPRFLDVNIKYWNL